MKKCGQCQFENSDQMSFCVQCGAPFAAAPFYDASGGAPDRSDAPDTLFGQSAETLGGGGGQPSARAHFAAAPVVTAARPGNGKKIFLIVGGVLALFGLLFAAGGLIVFFNWRSKTVAVTNTAPTPAPTRGIADRLPASPVPKSSASPAVSPRGAAPTSESAPPAPNAPGAPLPSFTPPIEPTKKGSFTVYANSGWQLSEIETVANETFRTSAAGLIDLANVKTGVTTRGVADAKSKSRRIYQEHPTGALMMRTRYADGKYSNVQPVSAGTSGTWRNFPDERGRLEFCVNDNAPEQNGGQFTVTKTSVSVPKAKK